MKRIIFYIESINTHYKWNINNVYN